MNSQLSLSRSLELMNSSDTGLLLIDFQQRLIPVVRRSEQILWNANRLITAAKLFKMPIALSEQYPKGLGKTYSSIDSEGITAYEKLSFSGVEEGPFINWKEKGVGKILLAGIETHVCVLQTALDLLASGFRVYVAVDGVSSRMLLDHDIALRRMEASGVLLTTVESALFEWCAVAGTNEFKKISALAKEMPPLEG